MYDGSTFSVALPFGATRHLEVRFVMKLLDTESTIGHINCQKVLKSSARRRRRWRRLSSFTETCEKIYLSLTSSTEPPDKVKVRRWLHHIPSLKALSAGGHFTSRRRTHSHTRGHVSGGVACNSPPGAVRFSHERNARRAKRERFPRRPSARGKRDLITDAL